VTVPLQSGIVVGFSTARHWYSATIRAFTRSKCSHTFLVYPWRGRNMIAEEGDVGWSIRTLDSLLETDTLVALLQPKVSLEKGFDESLAELGQPYGWLVLFGMFFVTIARRLGKKIRNPAASSHSMICSERIAYIMRDSGDIGALNFDPSSTTPEDILEYLS
jgi:hypothetical protein